MNPYRADLHIHSRFSRATSTRLTVPHLAAWAGAKGIDVLATGDFTHPEWRDELRAALTLDEASTLYRLRTPLRKEARVKELAGLEGQDDAEPLFMLEAEISSIYKKNGAVRKIHNLVYVPDFESADRLCARLDRIGNLKSDGRPILGLDARVLLELVLEIPGAFMIPAHIWTPWFSLFGSKSGFNSLTECFDDLAPEIFALETGLSSDPDMNRCWSHLDGLTMVSNSDAHSGENLAREATLFAGTPSYNGILDALRGRNQDYRGTLEFFPEEGKYHLDGHRACNVVLEPAECLRLGNICPVCHKPLTVGVLHRVLELADRQAPPEPGKNFLSLIPLAEILGELLHCGPKTKKPQLKLAELTRRFGPELTLLLDTPLADVGRHWPELGEALRRMRAREVIRQGGYDGEYGIIRLFGKEENRPSLLTGASSARLRPLPADDSSCNELGMDSATGSNFSPKAPPKSLQGAPLAAPRGKASRTTPEAAMLWAAALVDRDNENPAPRRHIPAEAIISMGDSSPAVVYTSAQTEALEAGPEPVLVLAGPGSGKTRTLVGRIARLLEKGVTAQDIVAVTFTRRAARELQERLAVSLPPALTNAAQTPEADTLHALALKHWPGETPIVLSEEAARRAFALAAGLDTKSASTLWNILSLGREKQDIPGEVKGYADAYAAWKKARGLADYTDLPETWLETLLAGAPRPWKQVLVDEAQDLSPLQRSLVLALMPEDGAGFFGIGDPDQSIYSFRGADANIAASLGEAWPSLRVLSLTESHRASEAILAAGRSTLGPDAACSSLRSVTGHPATLQWLQAPTEEREAAWVADRVAYLVGGTSHQQADLHEELTGCHLAAGSCSPGDVAVLVRLKALMSPLRVALERRGIPCSTPEAEAFWTDPQTDRILQGAAWFLRDAASAPSKDAGGATDVFAVATDPLLASISPDAWSHGPDAVLAAVRAANHIVALPPESEKAFDPLFDSSPAFRNLKAAFRNAGGDWKKLLDFVTLSQELDLVQSRAERVQIMTLHASKGLEFKAVFLPCLEDGLLPFHGMNALLGEGQTQDQNLQEPDCDMGEERRLLYVGLTRAAEAVFASSADQRRIYGHTLRQHSSPLLPLSCFHAVTLKRHTKVTANQLSLFR